VAAGVDEDEDSDEPFDSVLFDSELFDSFDSEELELADGELPDLA